MSTVACMRLSTETLTPKAIGMQSANRLPDRRPPSRPSANISVMPAIATAIAIQVRGATRSDRNNRPNKATKNGDTLVSTIVFATVVRVSANMKKKNMDASSAPDTIPARPTARIMRPASFPCQRRSTMVMNRVRKAERQNTISQASWMDKLRTRIPARLQHSAADTMRMTPRRLFGLCTMEYARIWERRRNSLHGRAKETSIGFYPWNPGHTCGECHAPPCAWTRFGSRSSLDGIIQAPRSRPEVGS